MKQVMKHALIALLGALLLAGCGRSKANLPAAGSVDADKYLFEHGSEALKQRHWVQAREYFRKLIDTYPQSSYRQEAKLAIGDSYLGEDSVDSNILAVNEFKEFLAFFPGNSRTDYAQYKLAKGYAQQMLGPERDPTPAKDTLSACDTFLRIFPSSDLRPDVEKVRRDALDDLSGHDYRIGLFYYRVHWYPGAIERFKGLLDKDPAYPQRDSVYFYLGEMYHAMAKTGRAGQQDNEALPYFDRIVQEFEKSDYLERARKRIAEIKQPATIKR